MHDGPHPADSANFRVNWILNGRNTFQSTVRKSKACFKAHPKSSVHKMSNLPSARVNISRLFSNTGIEFAGP